MGQSQTVDCRVVQNSCWKPDSAGARSSWEAIQAGWQDIERCCGSKADSGFRDRLEGGMGRNFISVTGQQEPSSRDNTAGAKQQR